MKKIPTLFQRSEDRRSVIDAVTPGCEWVTEGGGVATRKYDGTCCMLDEAGDWWARREVKPGKTAPDGWVEVDHDETTGKRVGWEPIGQTGFARWRTEALAGPGAWLIGHQSAVLDRCLDTYELVGPKVNGNPEGLKHHALIPHGYLAAEEWDLFAASPRDFDGLKDWLSRYDGEGIVWHHPDGRMAKIKRRDFPAVSRGEEAR